MADGVNTVFPLNGTFHATSVDGRPPGPITAFKSFMKMYFDMRELFNPPKKQSGGGAPAAAAPAQFYNGGSSRISNPSYTNALHDYLLGGDKRRFVPFGETGYFSKVLAELGKDSTAPAGLKNNPASPADTRIQQYSFN